MKEVKFNWNYETLEEALLPIKKLVNIQIITHILNSYDVYLFTQTHYIGLMFNRILTTS